LAPMNSQDENRSLALMVDYLFGRGVSKALPKKGFRFYHSRRSGRIKSVFLDGRLFATVKPNGAMALSIDGARILARSPRFKENCVQVSNDVTEFVRGGRSVFCKFVKYAGKNILPKSEVAITDSGGTVIGVGMAVLNGAFMQQFSTGVAVRVRKGLGDS
jgi:predicted RNA-binding protein (TIGR00451 family)